MSGEAETWFDVSPSQIAAIQATERQRIVAWLRERQAEEASIACSFAEWTTEWITHRERSEAFEEAADSIEAGDHTPQAIEAGTAEEEI
ncbi:MAG: hypothetical protein ACSLE1_03030 [Sphingobium sp.]